MDSQTYYLKYRPQKISELDSVDVREGLQKSLKSGKIPHALLFSGPRGTGKTSAARIVAKAINCLKKGERSFEPCNRCEICQEITNGTSLDLIEIDGASNRGIDDIRNLKDKIKLSPARAKYKVYIIDEVHMLTTEAFNALLKTLEEPPAHAVFILCTTAPEKLPATIISRCTRFNFPKAKTEEVVRPLKRAVEGEKLKVEKGVLEEIASSVDGSFRDAHKILEQLAGGGKEISLKETRKLLGQVEDLDPEKLLSFLAKKDLKSSLSEIDRVVREGGDLVIYLKWLIEQLRIILLRKVGVAEEEVPEKTEQLISSLSKEEALRLIDLFSLSANQAKVSPIPQLPLELVAITWCAEGERHPDGSSKQSQPKKVVDKKGSGTEEIDAKWAALLLGLKPLNHSVEALLRAARPLKMTNGMLTIEVFYRFHKERLETEKCRSLVEQVASQLLARPIKVKCVLGQKPTPLGRASTPEVSSSPTTDDPDVLKTAEEIFGADIN